MLGVQWVKRELTLLYFREYKDEEILNEMLRVMHEHASVVATDVALTESKALIQSWQQGDRETWDCLQDVMRRLVAVGGT